MSGLDSVLTADNFATFIRTVELLVMVYMLRVLYDVKAKTVELHEWHDQDSPKRPGQKIWWTDPAVAESLHAIAKNSAKQNVLMEKLVTMEEAHHVEVIRAMNGGGRHIGAGA